MSGPDMNCRKLDCVGLWEEANALPHPGASNKELFTPSCLALPCWRKGTDAVPQHPSSGAEMIRVHSSPWGYLYCAHGQL